MTSVYRLGHRSSDSHDETVRIGLTEAEAETLGMILSRVAGANGRNGPGSRRVHAERILEGLAAIGVVTLDEMAYAVRGAVTFPVDAYLDQPLPYESEVVKFL